MHTPTRPGTREHAHKYVTVLIAFPWQQWFANAPLYYVVRILSALCLPVQAAATGHRRTDVQTLHTSFFSTSIRPCSTIVSLSHLSMWPSRTCVYPSAILTCKDSNAPAITALSSCVYWRSYSREERNNWMRWCKRGYCYWERDLSYTLRFAETKVQRRVITSGMGRCGNTKDKMYGYCHNWTERTPTAIRATKLVDILDLNLGGRGFKSWLIYVLPLQTLL